MLLLRSLPFLLREALINLRRHSLMTAAAVSTIAVALALLGTFSLTFYQVHAAARHALSAFELRVFCRRDVPTTATQALQSKIRALPGVSSVAFKSRKEIWAEQTRDSGLDLTGVPNLMPDTYIVGLADARTSGAVATALRRLPGVESVELLEEEVRQVVRLAEFVRIVGTVVGVLILLGALVVVSNTVRISVFSRRREIRIMQIVGATSAFIRLPLVLEGLIHGLTGGALACVAVYAFTRYAGGLIGSTVPLLVAYGAPVDMLRVEVALLLAGAAVGACGSALAIRRYLRSGAI